MRRPEQEKIRAITGTDLKSSFSCGAWSSKACVRGHERSASHLVNRAQTSNKAHDKFVPRRDCACADHSRPSLSPALLGGWSSHLVLIRLRLTTPLSQAPLLGQDKLTRRKRNLDTRGLSVRLHTLFLPSKQSHRCCRKQRNQNARQQQIRNVFGNQVVFLTINNALEAANDHADS